MIRARQLGKRFGEKRALRGVDLDVVAGGFAVVTGPNGSGKTTLLRLCAGLALPSEGKLEVDVPRAAVGYLGHEPLVYRELTALDAAGAELLDAQLTELRGAQTVLVSTHDPDRVAPFATQQLALA